MRLFTQRRKMIVGMYTYMMYIRIYDAPTQVCAYTAGLRFRPSHSIDWNFWLPNGIGQAYH